MSILSATGEAPANKLITASKLWNGAATSGKQLPDYFDLVKPFLDKLDSSKGASKEDAEDENDVLRPMRATALRWAAQNRRQRANARAPDPRSKHPTGERTATRTCDIL